MLAARTIPSPATVSSFSAADTSESDLSMGLALKSSSWIKSLASEALMLLITMGTDSPERAELRNVLALSKTEASLVLL